MFYFYDKSKNNSEIKKSFILKIIFFYLRNVLLLSIINSKLTAAMIDFFIDDNSPRWNKGDIVGKNIIVGFNSDENGVEVAILKRLSRYKVIRRFQVWWYKNI